MFYLGLLCILCAGVLNGSFVIPSKFIRSLSYERIWVLHGALGFIVIPWLLLLIFFPHSLGLYGALSESDIVLLVVSGMIFGLGQMAFFYAIDDIGVALSFTVNLGVGVALGTIFVGVYHSTLFTGLGYISLLAVFLTLCALWVYFKAGKTHEKRRDKRHGRYRLGWYKAIFAGTASGIQNISFILVAYHVTAITGDSYWYWPLFLTIASVPVLIGFLSRIKRASSNKKKTVSLRCFILIILMGLFFSGSLVLYSVGMKFFTMSQQIVAWPLLMISIILTSQVWGWLLGEINHVEKHKKYWMGTGTIILLFSVMMIAASQ